MSTRHFCPICQNIFRGLKCGYETSSTPLPDSAIIFTRSSVVLTARQKPTADVRSERPMSTWMSTRHFWPICQNIFRGLKCGYETPSTPLPGSVIIFTRTSVVLTARKKPTTDVRYERRMSIWMSTRHFWPICQNIFRGLKCGYETPSTPLPGSVIIFTQTSVVFTARQKPTADVRSERPMSIWMSTRHFCPICQNIFRRLKCDYETSSTPLSDSVIISTRTFSFSLHVRSQRPTSVMNVQCPFDVHAPFLAYLSKYFQGFKVWVGNARYFFTRQCNYFDADVCRFHCTSEANGRRPFWMSNVHFNVHAPFLAYLLKYFLGFKVWVGNAQHSFTRQCNYFHADLCRSHCTSEANGRRPFWMSNVHLNVHAPFLAYLSKYFQGFKVWIRNPQHSFTRQCNYFHADVCRFHCT